MKKKIDFTVIDNEQKCSSIYKMQLAMNNFSEDDKAFLMGINPGHFCQVEVARSGILLRRPFTVFECIPEEGVIDILYKVSGKGTEALKRYSKGDVVNVILPLGNCFPIVSEKKVVIVAGGIGVATMNRLVRTLKQLNNTIYFFYGAANKESLVYKDSLAPFCDEVFVSTDDGSEGYEGFITDPLKTFLDEKPDSYVVYGCGPTPLLYMLSDISKIRKLESYLSFETVMACGFGICAGCVISVCDGGEAPKYVRVCKEGTIFKGAEVIHGH